MLLDNVFKKVNKNCLPFSSCRNWNSQEMLLHSPFHWMVSIFSTAILKSESNEYLQSVETIYFCLCFPFLDSLCKNRKVFVMSLTALFQFQLILRGNVNKKLHDTVACGSVHTDCFVGHIFNPQMILSIQLQLTNYLLICFWFWFFKYSFSFFLPFFSSCFCF